MGRRKNKIKGIVDSSKTKSEKFYNKLMAAARFVFTLFLTGITHTVGTLVLLLSGVEVPGERIFAKAQSFVTEKLYSFAQKSADDALEQLKPGAKVSIDGSWTHRRNSLTFILDVIDISTKKIVAFVVLDKGTNHRHGNYKGPSNLMEAEAFRQIIPKLMKCNKIGTLIKDGDVKLDKIVKEYKWNVDIHYDPNHQLKNWPNLFKKFNKLAGGTLKGLKERIRAFLEVNLYSDISVSEKVNKFLNAYQHFLGNHENCPKHAAVKDWTNKDNPKARYYLSALLNESAKILTESFPMETTNFNENFHSLKARYVPKAMHLGGSFLGRLSCSILQYNDPYNWIFILLKDLGFSKTLPLHVLETVVRILYSQYKRYKNQHVIKLDEKYKKDRQAKKKKTLKLEMSGKRNILAYN